MRAIKDVHGAEQVAFSVTTPSGSHISDSIAWIERLIRAYGSPNTIYATEICNWHKDFASRFTYGTDIGTPDFAHTDCVLLWGNNPAATWLARATEVQKAVRRGARLIVVDPRPTALARRADQWLQVVPGTDQVLALGLANLMIANGTFDAGFVAQWTNGPLLVRADTGRFLRQSDLDPAGSRDVLYAHAAAGGSLIAYEAKRGVWIDQSRTPELRPGLDVHTPAGMVACRTAFGIFAAAAAEYPPERVAAITGVDEAALANAAAILATSSSVAYYAWNGIAQSLTATQTDRAISILYVLTGSYGRQGGNVPGGAAAFADIPDQEGVSQLSNAGCFSMSIGPTSCERALLILYTLAKALEARGHTLRSDNGCVRVIVEGEPLMPRIYETKSKRPYEPTAADLKEQASYDERSRRHPTWYPPDKKVWRTWTYFPSGRLCLVVSDPSRYCWQNGHLIGRWYDRKTKALEAYLGEVIIALSPAAVLIKHRRAEEEEQARIRAEEAERRRREEARRQRAAKRHEFLLKKADAHAKYMALLKFCNFLEAEIGSNLNEPADRLASILRRLVEAERQKFYRSVLNSEAAVLGLFSDDDEQL
jgi:hypothetical protein